MQTTQTRLFGHLFPPQIAAKPAQSLGLSNQPISQTVGQPTAANYSYRVPEFRISIAPNCISLGTIFSTPTNGVAYTDKELVQFTNTHETSFRSNKDGRWLSAQGAKKLQRSIHYMVQGSRLKRQSNGQRWRLSMLTLTLPAYQAHEDKTLNKSALNQFFVQARRWGVRNYVWDRECQENGNVHWHITLDRFVDHRKVRKTWNSIMRKLGYIDRYRAKHESMTEQKYISTYIHRYQAKNGKSALERCISAYNYGVKTNWSDPNSTDVRAVKSAYSLARYCAKHAVKMSYDKPPEIDPNQTLKNGTNIPIRPPRYSLEYRRTTGRKWGRSESLSRLAKQKVYRIGTHRQLQSYFNRIREKLGQLGHFIEGERFQCLFFEPFSSNEVSAMLRPIFAAAGYQSG